MKSFIEKVKTFFINFMNADKAVQIRTVAFFTSLIAMIAQTFFKKELVLNPETITNYIIEFGVVILGTRSWWKNNSLTPEARIGDEYMRAAQQTIFEEVEEFDENELENEG